MDIFVFTIVLFAALLHATWNAVLKSGANKFAAITWVVIGQMGCALVALAFLPLSAFLSSVTDWWPYFVSSAIFHLGYQIFLAYSYSYGDMSEVYPIARGIAPLLVTAFMVSVGIEHLTWVQLAGVGFVGGGVLSLGISRMGMGAERFAKKRAMRFALITGLFIAAYSISDATGARISGAPIAFFAALSVVDAVLMVTFMWFFRRGDLRPFWQKNSALNMVGGLVAYVAYTIVMWAFTQAPVSLVTALRETSIVFALLISVLFLKERLSFRKSIAIILIFAGAVLTKL